MPDISERLKSGADVIATEREVYELLMDAYHEIESLRRALLPLSISLKIAEAALGDNADTAHLRAVAKNYIGYETFKQASLLVNADREVG